MMSVTAAIEPLRAANRLLGKPSYSWCLISHDGAAVSASNGTTVEVDASLADAPRTDFLFVCAGLVTDPPYRTRLNTWLNAAVRRGTLVGSLSGGTFILARAGLLENARCTIHWEHWPAFEQEFPFIDCVSTLYEIDHDRYTCAGGTASMDLMLYLIELDHGPAVSRAVGNQFQVDRIRRGGVAQRSGQMERLEQLPPRLQNAVSRMLLNLQTPLSTKQLAADVNISVRNMERLFRRHLKMSPARYYMVLRLQRARDLLIHSNLSVLDAAVATGFASSSYFAHCYSRQFGENPSRHRLR
jgi:transcriptional regulator GlxA family with amidase domain